MIVLDGEFSGLDSKKNVILSIGAVEFENPENEFYEECYLFEGCGYEEEALEINGFTKDEIFDKSKNSLKQLLEKFLKWLKKTKDGSIIIGQNVFTDREFLDAAFKKCDMKCPFGHRIIDLHSICFSKHLELKIKIPTKFKRYQINSDYISKFCGIPDEPRPHLGINGARWEAEQFSRLVYGEKLLKRFEEFEIPKYLLKK